jgi:hypothetical protein
VYCDSRDAVTRNGACDFTISLPENLELGPSTTYRIDHFRMIHAMPNITNKNCYIYIRTPNGAVMTVSLDQGYYTAQTLATMMRDDLNFAAAGWSCTWDSTQNTFEIRNNNFAWRFLTDAELATGNYDVQIKWGVDVDATPLQPNSFNSILQNFAGTSSIITANSFKVRFLNLQAYDYVTLRSKRLSSNHVKSSRNEHDILLKIPINVAYGNVMTASTPNIDSLKVGRTLHKTLDFQICDRMGNVITSLYDPSISFTLVLYG